MQTRELVAGERFSGFLLEHERGVSVTMVVTNFLVGKVIFLP